MKHHEGDDNESSATAGQQLVDENKTLMDSKTALKRKASISKKIYIHNYFTRARSWAGEGDEEGDHIAPVDDPTLQAPQALATLPSPILEHDPARHELSTEENMVWSRSKSRTPLAVRQALAQALQ
ncbi:hypothetical protein NDU88_006299 [Pleurodeles waltl]|uniref:Uncharacterized protein n=1 Tax=Pleurodeles waltl TaxID=8319 RepID=A0AAV7WX72_PLEWA|nr:hypothetical protein NDU88_006299 [Pleurodeles waltl]